MFFAVYLQCVWGCCDGSASNFRKKMNLFLTFCEALALFTPLWIRCLLYGPGMCWCQCSFWKEEGDKKRRETLLKVELAPRQAGHVFWRRMGAFHCRDSVLILLVFLCSKILSYSTAIYPKLALSPGQALKERVCSAGCTLNVMSGIWQSHHHIKSHSANRICPQFLLYPGGSGQNHWSSKVL